MKEFNCKDLKGLEPPEVNCCDLPPRFRELNPYHSQFETVTDKKGNKILLKRFYFRNERITAEEYNKGIVRFKNANI